MRMTRPAVAVAVLALACGVPVAAQTASPTPAVEGLTLAQTLNTLARTAGSAATAEALILGTVLEIGTTPLPTASPGFIYKVDPATGLRVRQATTFGPSFTERALTSGEGKVAVYASVSAASYEQFGDLSLERMQLSSVTASSPLVQRRGLASLVIQAETVTMATSVGVTDKFDLSVSVPLVRVSLDGIAWMEDGNQRVLVRAEGAGTSTGLGDIAVTGKYRLTGAGEGPPDPGGLAVIGTARMPTGDRDNFRGLGITRLLGSVVYSSGKGRFRPHGNAGFEYWTDSLDALTEGMGSGQGLGPSPVPVRRRVRVRRRAEVDPARGPAWPSYPRRRGSRRRHHDAAGQQCAGATRRDGRGVGRPDSTRASTSSCWCRDSS